MGERLAKKVLLVGWDAADWKVITPLLDAGKMPALESIINRGVMGNLLTLEPPLSPMLWTSIATGTRADKHGILGFTEPDPSGTNIRPVSGLSRKGKAIWNIMTQEGLGTHVIGWWPSHPAEPINGVCVSNFYHRAPGKGKGRGRWPMPAGAVHPEDLRKTLARLRIHPRELTAADLLPFVPEAAKVDQDKDRHLASLAKIVAECSTVHAAATWVMENQPWDFMAVYYDAIDHFSHGFMNFHPPKMPHVSQEVFDLYQHVVEGGYRFHDMMLGRLLSLAGPDTTVVVVSDHGFHSDHLRPPVIPKVPAGPAIQHRPLGIICMAGDHIVQDERIYGANLLDIAPTILYLLGLPVGEDMDGHVLMQAFVDPAKPEFVESWEQVEGDCGMHPTDKQEDPYEQRESMQQLVALGYIEKPSGDRQVNVERTVREAKFNLARVHLHAQQLDEATEILEELLRESPDQSRFALPLAQCYYSLGRLSECRRVIEDVFENEKEKLAQIEEEARKRREEKGDAKEGEDEQTTDAKGKGKGKGKDEPEIALIPPAQLYLLQGALFLAEEEPEKALPFLAQAERANPRLPHLHQQIGRCYQRLRRWEDAERAYLRALEIDPDSADAHYGLARSYLRMRKYEEAAEEALKAVGIIHRIPRAHYHLGVALLHLGEVDHAEQAFQVALKLNRQMVPAHRWLAFIYQRQGKATEAQHHREQAEQLMQARRKSRQTKDDGAGR